MPPGCGRIVFVVILSDWDSQRDRRNIWVEGKRPACGFRTNQ